MPELSQDLHRKESDNLIQLVTFKIAEEEFGVDILKVQEIIRMMPITKVPNAPPFVEGVINLRGKVIPVIDMRKRFGMAASPHDSQTRIEVMDLQGQIIGFVVDAVSEVLRIKESTVEPPPPVVAGIGSEYMRGVGKLQDRLLILLDLDKLLSENELQSLTSSIA
ncbi:MAG: chemotaxis protein CheW [Bilophila sp.]